MAEAKQPRQPFIRDSADEDAEQHDNVVTSRRFALLQAELDMRSRMQTAIAELGQASLTLVDSDLLTAQACALLVDTLEVDMSRALEYSDEEQRLVTRAAVGWMGRQTFDDEEVLLAYHSDETIVFENLAHERRFESRTLAEAGVVSGICTTLTGRGASFGVLAAYSRTAREFRDYEVEFIRAVANVLSAAIESKRTREELAETRAQIIRREKLASIGSWIWTRGNRIWQWSEEIYRLLEQPVDEVESDYATFLSHVHPADRAAFAALIERASGTAGEHELQHRLIAATGEPRVVRTSVQGAFGRDGKPVRLVGITQDLTTVEFAIQEKVRLSALIELAAQEWRMTCDAIDAVVLVLDRNFTVLRLNERARRLLHLTFEDAIGGELPYAAAGEPWATVRQLVTVISETHLSSRAEAQDTIRGKQWELSARLLSHASVADERIVVVAQDVTDQATREKVRREADVLDSLTQFIGALYDRTEQPLGDLIALLAQHLSTIQLEDAELRRARSATYELSRLFRELDEYARPFSLDPNPRDVEPLLENAINDASELARKRRVGIEAEISDVTPVLMNDARLQQLFGDLLKLFIDRSDEGTTITITLDESPWRMEEWVTLIISTPRLIFRPEDLHSMLDPHVPRVNSEELLRLSIDRRIVDEHGGTMLLVNRSDEARSFISLRLPPFRKR